ncbi:hypothetical protein CSB11_02590 [Candidatus Campbellbacteria bacterium]|nr:MAG: hypothetical protein CSB11_02590 [Candidatus Campbellbacteria bacterium]
MPEEKNNRINTSDVKENLNQKDNNFKKRSNVKTYRDFAVSALKDKPTSLAKMVIEEKKKQEFEYQTSTKNPKNMFLIIISSVLVVLGVIAVAVALIFTTTKISQNKENSLPLEPQSLIYFDYKKEIFLEKLDRENILQITKNSIHETQIPIGDIKLEYFVKMNKYDKKTLVTAKEFIKAMDTRVSVQFIKNLNDQFSYGIYSHIEGNRPFLVLRFTDIDSVYTNLLSWEKMIISDLGSLFNINRVFYSRPFVDLTLHNKDARVIMNGKGEVVFGYSFIDLNHLVFFTNSDQFNKIIGFFNNYQKK